MRIALTRISLVVLMSGFFLFDSTHGSADSGGSLGTTTESAAAVLGAGKGFHCWVESGAAKCIGLNAQGQLGDGTLIGRTSPVTVTGLSSGVVAIAAGDAHSCALTSGGAVMCWGSNDRGQLGDGTTTDSSTPRPATGLSSGAIRIEAGIENSCAITSAGQALCWGNNQTYGAGSITVDANADGEFDPVLVPTQVLGLSSGVVAITINGERTSTSASTVHGCALLQYGDLKCWGSNGNGQLGITTAGPEATPMVVPLTSRVTAVSAGALHTCAILESSAVTCWGANGNGQLATGATTSLATGTLHPVSGASSGIVQISAGRYTTCAVTTSGGLLCWGDNIYGLIEPTVFRTSVTTPVVPHSLTSGIEAISLSEYSTCALFVSGDLRCWGANSNGQTGDGYQVRTISPVAVHSGVGNATPLTGVQSVGSSRWSNCAITTSGGLKCWGNNSSGELGDGSNIGSPEPVDHATLTSGVQSVEGRGTANCALMTSGQVRCWGQNGSGIQATGDNTSNLTTRTMLLAPSTPVTGVTDVSMGDQHSCVVANGGAFCAGRNFSGPLGDGSTTSSNYLVPVSGLSSGVAKIVAGHAPFSCAVLTDGTGRCWGNDANGQLGNGSGSSSNTPVVVSGLTGAVDIVAGENFVCARIQDGTVQCWGQNNFGQLGNGNTTTQQSPVTVVGLTGVTHVVAGPRSMCALVANGELKCWGWNVHGIFADGTTNNSLQPVTAQGVSGVISISKGYTSVCVVLATNEVKCWGSEQSGQLGNNRMENRTYSTHVVLATGLVRSSSLAPLTLLAPTTTVPATTTVPVATTIPSDASAPTNTSTVATADENLRVDNKVYVVPPRSVGQLAMLRIVRSSNMRKISLSSVTPKICVAGGQSVVTIRSGDCRVLIRSLKTGTVLRQWKTAVVAADTSIGTTVRVAPAIVFPRASLRADRTTLKNARALVRGSQSAFVVGHSAFLTGKTPENRRLSHQRAAHIAQTLRKRTNIKQVVSIGIGGGAPVSSVLRESSQRKNRRVVIYYVPS